MYYVFALPCSTYQCIIVLGLAASIHMPASDLPLAVFCMRYGRRTGLEKTAGRRSRLIRIDHGNWKRKQDASCGLPHVGSVWQGFFTDFRSHLEPFSIKRGKVK